MSLGRNDFTVCALGVNCRVHDVFVCGWWVTELAFKLFLVFSVVALYLILYCSAHGQNLRDALEERQRSGQAAEGN